VCVRVCDVVPDTAAALAVGPIKPIIGQAKSQPGMVCIIFYTQEFFETVKSISNKMFNCCRDTMCDYVLYWKFSYL